VISSGPRRNRSRECLSFDKLEHETAEFGLFFDPVDRCDVGVIERVPERAPRGKPFPGVPGPRTGLHAES
jgi:hypothetical protein